jgi:hypothetical protein
LPNSALARRRSPLAQRPWVRVMLVLAQVGFGPGFVDEQKAGGINRRLARLPALMPEGDIRPILSGRAQALWNGLPLPSAAWFAGG